MSDDKKKPIRISPKGTAVWPDYLYKKDNGPAASPNKNPKYNVHISFDKKDKEAAKWIKEIQDSHFAQDGTKKNCPVKDGDKRKPKEGRENYLAGKWFVKLTSIYKPTTVDAKKVKLPKGLRIFSGDLIRVAFQDNVIDEDSGSAVTGHFLRLCSVQLLEKRGGGGNVTEAGADAFGEEEGFDANTWEPEDEEDEESDEAPPADENGGDF